MTASKTRKFDGKTYTFAGEFDTKRAARGYAIDRILPKASGSQTNFRLLKLESHAPPQGDIFYRLYYRYHSGR